jgi:hypothetical protein
VKFIHHSIKIKQNVFCQSIDIYYNVVTNPNHCSFIRYNRICDAICKMSNMKNVKSQKYQELATHERLPLVFSMVHVAQTLVFCVVCISHKYILIIHYVIWKNYIIICKTYLYLPHCGYWNGVHILKYLAVYNNNAIYIVVSHHEACIFPKSKASSVRIVIMLASIVINLKSIYSSDTLRHSFPE